MNSNGNGVVIICIAVLLASQVKTELSTNEPGAFNDSSLLAAGTVGKTRADHASTGNNIGSVDETNASHKPSAFFPSFWRPYQFSSKQLNDIKLEDSSKQWPVMQHRKRQKILRPNTLMPRSIMKFVNDENEKNWIKNAARRQMLRNLFRQQVMTLQRQPNDGIFPSKANQYVDLQMDQPDPWIKWNNPKTPQNKDFDRDDPTLVKSLFFDLLKRDPNSNKMAPPNKDHPMYHPEAPINKDLDLDDSTLVKYLFFDLLKRDHKSNKISSANNEKSTRQMLRLGKNRRITQDLFFPFLFKRDADPIKKSSQDTKISAKYMPLLKQDIATQMLNAALGKSEKSHDTHQGGELKMMKELFLPFLSKRDVDPVQTNPENTKLLIKKSIHVRQDLVPKLISSVAVNFQNMPHLYKGDDLSLVKNLFLPFLTKRNVDRTKKIVGNTNILTNYIANLHNLEAATKPTKWLSVDSIKRHQDDIGSWKELFLHLLKQNEQNYFSTIENSVKDNLKKSPLSHDINNQNMAEDNILELRNKKWLMQKYNAEKAKEPFFDLGKFLLNRKFFVKRNGNSKLTNFDHDISTRVLDSDEPKKSSGESPILLLNPTLRNDPSMAKQVLQQGKPNDFAMEKSLFLDLFN